MKTKVLLAAALAALAVLVGCETVPPGAERGPHGTIAYYVQVDATPPGARIEVNGESIGNTPVTFKVFGDKDGTFHDFGSYYYMVRAFPLTTNQYPQARYFHTGRMFTPEDMIPKNIYFDMNQPTPVYATPDYGPPVYYGPPPYYYGPYYGPGPSFRFYFGGPHRRW